MHLVGRVKTFRGKERRVFCLEEVLWRRLGLPEKARAYEPPHSPACRLFIRSLTDFAFNELSLDLLEEPAW